MTRKQNGLGLALTVAAACLALLLLLIALTTRTSGDETNPAVGFPVILGGLAVVAILFAVVWRAVHRKKSSGRR